MGGERGAWSEEQNSNNIATDLLTHCPSDAPSHWHLLTYLFSLFTELLP